MRWPAVLFGGLVLACGDGGQPASSQTDTEERELERRQDAEEARTKRIQELGASRDPDAFPVLLAMATSEYHWEDGYTGSLGLTESTAISSVESLVISFRGPEPDGPRLRRRARAFLVRPEVVRRLGSLLDSSAAQHHTLGVLTVLPVPQLRSRIQLLAADRSNWLAGVALKALDDFEHSPGLLDSRGDGGAGHPEDR